MCVCVCVLGGSLQYAQIIGEAAPNLSLIQRSLDNCKTSTTAATSFYGKKLTSHDSLEKNKLSLFHSDKTKSCIIMERAAAASACAAQVPDASSPSSASLDGAATTQKVPGLHKYSTVVSGLESKLEDLEEKEAIAHVLKEWEKERKERETRKDETGKRLGRIEKMFHFASLLKEKNNKRKEGKE